MTVVTLNARNSPGFAKKAESGNWVVLYHMHTCPHCVMLRPTWDKVKKGSSGCNIAEVEYQFLEKLPSAMRNVRGFPTIMAYKNGKPVAEFTGDRTEEEIAGFVKKHGSPAPKKAATAAPKKKKTSA